MTHLKSLCVIVALVLLAACGGDPADEVLPTLAAEAPLEDASSDTTNDAPADTSDTSTTADTEEIFSATVTGAVQTEITGNGMFVCSDEYVSLGGLPYLEIQSGGSFTEPYITMRFPLGTEAGTIPLVGSGDAPISGTDIGEASILLNGASGEPDWTSGTGELTLETVPSAGREPVVGSFTAQLTSNDSEAQGSITVEGSFDFLAESYAFDEGQCSPEGQATAQAEDAAAQAASDAVELPDVPADLEGITVTISDVQGGFSAEAVPMRVQTALCAGSNVQWVLGDDTGNDGPDVSLTLVLPLDLTAGRYAIGNIANAETVGVAINTLQLGVDDPLQFGAFESGAIRLDNIPAAEGETLTGALATTLQPRRAPTINPENDPAPPDEAIDFTAVFNIPAEANAICSE